MIDKVLPCPTQDKVRTGQFSGGTRPEDLRDPDETRRFKRLRDLEPGG